MLKQESPDVEIHATCNPCVYLCKEVKPYSVKCIHPDRTEPGTIEVEDCDYSPDYYTPRWCPLLKGAIEKAVTEVLGEK